MADRRIQALLHSLREKDKLEQEIAEREVARRDPRNYPLPSSSLGWLCNQLDYHYHNGEPITTKTIAMFEKQDLDAETECFEIERGQIRGVLEAIKDSPAKAFIPAVRVRM